MPQCYKWKKAVHFGRQNIVCVLLFFKHDLFTVPLCVDGGDVRFISWALGLSFFYCHDRVLIECDTVGIVSAPVITYDAALTITLSAMNAHFICYRTDGVDPDCAIAACASGLF